MDVRSGLEGDSCSSRGEGLSLGTSVKLIERPLFGNSVCVGRGEEGMSGLGSSMGETVGEDDGESIV
jgi:hypothetical protein